MSQLDEEKKFYERFWALLSNADLMKVFERFGPEAFRRSSVLEGFERFLVEQRFSGRRCVEIGTLKGLTAVVLARRFDEVVSIDVVDDPQRQQVVALLKLRNIRFVTVRDNAEKAAVVDALGFDAAYVDGDHARDTSSDFALVKRGGRVLLHEYWEAQPSVWGLVNELRSRGPGAVVTRGKLALWTG